MNRKSIEKKIIVCPVCEGSGYLVSENRVNAYETDCENKECYFCEGKRVVIKQITTEHMVIK